MIITPEELREAFRVSYQRLKDSPETFLSVEETLDDIPQSAIDATNDLLWIILDNRANKQ